MTYTLQQTQNIAIEILIVSLISSLTLIFTLYCYFKFQDLHNAQFKLVTRILISDLIYELIMLIVSITYFIYQDNQPLSDTHPVLCQFQAFISNFSILSSTAWTSIICHTLYNQIFHNTLSKIYYYQYIFAGYLIPAIISFIPFFIDAYGISYPMPQTNCFYNAHLPPNQFDLYISICYYLPIWLAFLYNLIIMILIVIKIRLYVFDIASNRQLMGLFIYPSILAICWVIPGIISQINIVNMAWDFTSQLLCNLVGFLDAICYCYTEIFTKLEFKKFRLSMKSNTTDDIIITTKKDLASLAQNSQQL